MKATVLLIFISMMSVSAQAKLSVQWKTDGQGEKYTASNMYEGSLSVSSNNHPDGHDGQLVIKNHYENFRLSPEVLSKAGYTIASLTQLIRSASAGEKDDVTLKLDVRSTSDNNYVVERIHIETKL